MDALLAAYDSDSGSDNDSAALQERLSTTQSVRASGSCSIHREKSRRQEDDVGSSPASDRISVKRARREPETGTASFFHQGLIMCLTAFLFQYLGIDRRPFHGTSSSSASSSPGTEQLAPKILW